jgi:uncharacterized protein (TIGR02611 family)
MERVKSHWQRTPAMFRKTIVAIIGGTIILAGLAMLILPGPGWVTIFVGLAVLATEFELALRLKKSLQKRVTQAATHAAKRLRKK